MVAMAAWRPLTCGRRLWGDCVEKVARGADCWVTVIRTRPRKTSRHKHGFPNIDDEARAELLTHLVVSQLIARTRTAQRLLPVHFVGAGRIWLAANGGYGD